MSSHGFDRIELFRLGMNLCNGFEISLVSDDLFCVKRNFAYHNYQMKFFAAVLMVIKLHTGIFEKAS